MFTGRQVDRKTLERIVALLVSFAVLADRAAGLPPQRRLLALAILGCGETVARTFVFDLAWEFGAAVAGDAAEAPPPDDAATLAASFRALALMLGALLAAIPRPARARACGPLPCLPLPRRPLAATRRRLAAASGPDPPRLRSGRVPPPRRAISGRTETAGWPNGHAFACLELNRA